MKWWHVVITLAVLAGLVWGIMSWVQCEQERPVREAEEHEAEASRELAEARLELAEAELEQLREQLDQAFATEATTEEIRTLQDAIGEKAVECERLKNEIEDAD